MDDTSRSETGPAGNLAEVTVVVTPRERFGVAVESLESIVDATRPGYELVYVDGGSPPEVEASLRSICGRHGFRYLRYECFLSPNQARNAGYRAVRTPYLAFVDNDVIVSEGWLTTLLECAEETGADVMVPLTCQKLPLHTEIHQAGGRFTADVRVFLDQPPAERRVEEVHTLQGERVEEVSLERGETQCCEFHCVLIRKEALDRTQGLDENLLATKEHIDFSLGVWAAGGRVVFEPRSIVTYLFPSRERPITRQDWPFFVLRWSPQWQKHSLDHFMRKWGLTHDPYFKGRDKMLSWRHNIGVAKPVVRSLPVVGRNKVVERYGAGVLTRMLDLWSRSLVRRQRREWERARGLPTPAGT